MLNDFKNLYPNVNVTTDVLLYGSKVLTQYDNFKIAKLVENFISRSGRFII